MSSVLGILCVIMLIHYISFAAHVHKMNLVKAEYHYHLEMLKKIIQEKNCDNISDDLDTFDDKDESVVFDVIPSDAITSLSLTVADQQVDEEILDEQDEDTQEFQFVSVEDEQQLKDLRKKSRQVVARHKTTKKNRKHSLGQRQIHQLQKNNTAQAQQDFTFHWPLELHHFWLSSLFGARKKANGTPGFHYGIDLAALKGTPVKAAAAGQVIQAQYLPGYGNNILIQHNKYYRTRYAHLQRMHVTVGQHVHQGQKIGTVGDSGSVRKNGRDASHLHFEIYHNGSHVNPLRYLFN